MYIFTGERSTDRSRGTQPEFSQALGVPPIIPLTMLACSNTRACCILAPYWAIDLASLGDHRGLSEKNGIIYTGGAGFIDTSHVRHTCDDTKRVYDQLVATNGSPTTSLSTTKGLATIKNTPVPANKWTQLARAISYADSLAYEITSYWLNVPGEHNSAFSPEDLCSNYLGTYIAERAINSPPSGSENNFKKAVTVILNNVFAQLKAQPTIETQRAFNPIMNCWMSPNSTYSATPSDYWGRMTLKRRNFSIVPWKVGHSSDFQTPAWVTQQLSGVSSYYDFTYRYLIGGSATTRGRTKTLKEADFSKEISKIRVDAKEKYGPKYDKPTCP